MTLTKGPQAFTRNEYLRRMARTKAAMAEQDLDALFVTEHANLIWLSGFTADSDYVEQSLVVDPSAEEPLLCVRAQDAPAAIYASFLDRSRIIAFPEHLIANPEASGYDHMIAQMRDRGLARGRIGVEFGELPYATVLKLQAALPGVELVDATALVTWLRLEKSQEELAVMAAAAEISDAAMLAAVAAIEPGVHESVAVQAATNVLIGGVEGAGGTQIYTPTFCTTPLIGTSHISWSDHVYAPGSQTNIELGGMRYRYCAGLMRTVHVGAPPDRLKSLHAAEREGLERGLEAAKSGNTCADVANAFHAAIARHGIRKLSRCGYAIGINWTETSASLKPEDHTVLKPNMTFHLMLGNWIEEDFGYVISETFAVTDSGGRSLSRCPRELFVK